MRARLPDESGYVVNDGVRVYYEVFGEAREPNDRRSGEAREPNDGRSGEAREQTLLLMPTWSLADSRHWKMQVPFLARHYRVITFDGRGNGRSDRPSTAAAYSDDAFVGDALAVLAATGTD